MLLNTRLTFLTSDEWGKLITSQPPSQPVTSPPTRLADGVVIIFTWLLSFPNFGGQGTKIDCLNAFLPVCLPVCLSTGLSVCLPVCQTNFLPVRLRLSHQPH